MNNNKIIREPINMEKVKEAEIEEKKEEIKTMEKDLTMEKVLATEKVIEKPVEKTEKDLKKYDKINKLKCNYEIFKNERDKSKMKVPEKCEICGKSFEKDDNIYAAFGEDLSEIFICKECAEKD